MSGGSFDYAYQKVERFADELAVRLDKCNKKNDYGETPHLYSQPTLDKLREIESHARYTAKLMQEVEWLYSGDNGEESFIKGVEEIERSEDEVQRPAA